MKIMRFKIGDEVWGIQRGWSEGIIHGKITKIETVTAHGGKEVDVIYIQGDSWMMSGTVAGQDVYESKNDAEQAYSAEIQNRIEEYKSKINTVEDLVRFMFNKNVAHAEEYTDYEARRAAIEKTKELLDIELGE